MADIINYNPIFTYIGMNKISKAIKDNSSIQLSHLALGDSGMSQDSNVNPSMTSLNNEITRIDVTSVKFTDVVDSSNLLMTVTGVLEPQDAPNMVIREYGIYDNEGDLLIISRYPDYHTMEVGMPITRMIFTSKIFLVNDTAALTQDFYPDSATTIEEFTSHTEDFNNPHNTTNKDIPGLENLNNTSDLNKPFNRDIRDLFIDAKIALGFKNRTDSKILNTSNSISIEPFATGTHFVVYKYGVKHIIEDKISINVEEDSYGYIGLNPETKKLYYIGEFPDFDTDILVTWYYSNSEDGIIWLNDERHGASRNIEDHRLTHNEVGALWTYGGELTTNDFTKLNIANYGISDEDIEIDVVHAAIPVNPFEQPLIDAKLPVLYVQNGRYRRVFNNDTLNWIHGVNGAKYNNLNTGELVDVEDDKYLTYVVLFTTCKNEPVKLVVGVGQYETEGEAESESFESYGLPMPELVAAYRIILHKHPNYVNAAQTKIKLITKITAVNDGGSADLTNHNLFTDRFNGIQHTTSAITGLDQALAEAGKLKDIEMVGTMKSVINVNEVTRNAELNTFQSNSKNMPAIYGGGNEFGESRVLVDNIPIGAWSGNGHILGLTEAANGHLYGSPASASKVYKVDTDTNKIYTIGTDFGTAIDKWLGGILAPNGNIYHVPWRSNRVMMVQPHTDTSSLIGTAFSPDAGKYMHYASSTRIDDIIYMYPTNRIDSQYTSIIEVNTTTNTTTMRSSNMDGAIGVGAGKNILYHRAGVVGLLNTETWSKTTILTYINEANLYFKKINSELIMIFGTKKIRFYNITSMQIVREITIPFSISKTIERDKILILVKAGTPNTFCTYDIKTESFGPEITTSRENSLVPLDLNDYVFSSNLSVANNKILLFTVMPKISDYTTANATVYVCELNIKTGLITLKASSKNDHGIESYFLATKKGSIYNFPRTGYSAYCFNVFPNRLDF